MEDKQVDVIHRAESVENRTGRAGTEMRRAADKKKDNPNHIRTGTPDHNNRFCANVHLSHKQIIPQQSRSVTYILQFSTAVTSPGRKRERGVLT